MLPSGKETNNKILQIISVAVQLKKSKPLISFVYSLLNTKTFQSFEKQDQYLIEIVPTENHQIFF